MSVAYFLEDAQTWTLLVKQYLLEFTDHLAGAFHTIRFEERQRRRVGKEERDREKAQFLCACVLGVFWICTNIFWSDSGYKYLDENHKLKYNKM